ncbi:MAG: glycosyltransferase family 2 protein [Pedosphaera sp.]|nr:glycosyltransferase family 2 protein [Pedosphaera sp.]
MTANPKANEISGAGFSVVVPFFNESENVVAVLRELRATLPEAEIIAVDDGSSDDTWQKIQQFGGCRGLRFVKNQGQSAAIYHGLRASTQRIVGMMDGDGQNDPANFTLLLAEFTKGQADVICGYRANRRDTWSRRAASKIANAIRRVFLDDGVRDTGCSQKVFHREAIELLVPFRGLHRYLPAIFKQAGLRLAEIAVNHRPRQAGVSKYSNWTRALHGIYDLIGVGWLLHRKITPPKIETSS